MNHWITTTTSSSPDYYTWTNGCRVITSTDVGQTITCTPGTWIHSPNHQQEEPMLENQPCPLCKNFAVRDAQGQDVLLGELRDHTPPKETSACSDKDWTRNGIILRVRVCATCGHIWSSRSAPAVEMPCTPGK